MKKEYNTETKTRIDDKDWAVMPQSSKSHYLKLLEKSNILKKKFITQSQMHIFIHTLYKNIHIVYSLLWGRETGQQGKRYPAYREF